VSRGATLLSCLVQEGEELLCLGGMSNPCTAAQVVGNGREASVSSGGGRERGVQQDGDAARDDLICCKRTANRS
jgi:hypothetical protein